MYYLFIENININNEEKLYYTSIRLKSLLTDSWNNNSTTQYL